MGRLHYCPAGRLQSGSPLEDRAFLPFPHHLLPPTPPSPNPHLSVQIFPSHLPEQSTSSSSSSQVQNQSALSRPASPLPQTSSTPFLPAAQTTAHSIPAPSVLETSHKERLHCNLQGTQCSVKDVAPGSFDMAWGWQNGNVRFAVFIHVPPPHLQEGSVGSARSYPPTYFIFPLPALSAVLVSRGGIMADENGHNSFLQCRVECS